MVYSERVKSTAGLQPLKFKRVVAIVYAFGGFSALCAILSKFVVQPLFEQLTYDRSVYAQEARDRLLSLNLKLEKVVSQQPKIRCGKKYIDSKTQTDTPAAKRVSDPERNDWAAQFKQTFHNPDIVYATELEKKIIIDLDKTQQYLRALLYGQVVNFSSVDLSLARQTSTKDAVSAFKQEIRSFKGAVLSL